MKKKAILLFLLPIFGLLANGTIDFNFLFNYANQAVPIYINEDNTPNNNRITDEVATLGRVLFYDTNLSLNNTISCASCHKQELAFGDDRVQSVGFDGGLTGRHSMRLVNARFGEEERFFWDERANSLEAQSTQPIQDHIEMGFSGSDGQPSIDSLLLRLADIPYYAELFNLAFDDTTITEGRMQLALAQFVRSIQSFDSAFDQGLEQTGNLNADFPNYTNQENLGKDLFLSNNGANCQRCHSAPEFDIDDNRDNNGIIGVIGDPTAVDLNNTRSPSLRDLFGPDGSLNGPLMHTGEFGTIREVIDHYDDIDIDPRNNNLDNRLRGNGNGQNLNLSENEKQALEAFLRTLTGADIYTNEKWSNPFDENGDLEIIGGTLFVDNDLDGYNSDEDCDDSNASINPAASEIPNNDVDEDCDGVVLVIDVDQDGFNSDEDCDDNNASINPSVAEIPNNDVDEDCDGVVLVIDMDQDGFNSDEDCDDGNASINPSVAEIPNNDVDEDCDGVVLVIDMDQDGFNSDEDCDDGNASINPSVAEIPNNDVDENCDGVVLVIDMDQDGFNSDEDCDDGNASINPSVAEIPNNDVDEDCDGVVLVIDMDQDGFNSDEDCDDGNASINPSVAEIPNNDIDEDCDGVFLVIDVDQDGFNSDEDCDDNDPGIYPGAEEIMDNGIDEDCDGEDAITTSIEEENNYELVVFPNPFIDHLKIESNYAIDGEVIFYDMRGSAVKSFSVENQETVTIDLFGLSSGTYFVRVQDSVGQTQKVFRVIKI